MFSTINHISYICGKFEWDNAAPPGYFYTFSDYFKWRKYLVRFVKTMNGSKGGYN